MALAERREQSGEIVPPRQQDEIDKFHLKCRSLHGVSQTLKQTKKK